MFFISSRAQGVCLRYPPDSQGKRNITNLDGWCGEFSTGG